MTAIRASMEENASTPPQMKLLARVCQDLVVFIAKLISSTAVLTHAEMPDGAWWTLRGVIARRPFSRGPFVSKKPSLVRLCLVSMMGNVSMSGLTPSLAIVGVGFMAADARSTWPSWLRSRDFCW